MGDHFITLDNADLPDPTVDHPGEVIATFNIEDLTIGLDGQPQIVLPEGTFITAAAQDSPIAVEEDPPIYDDQLDILATVSLHFTFTYLQDISDNRQSRFLK